MINKFLYQNFILHEIYVTTNEFLIINVYKI